MRKPVVEYLYEHAVSSPDKTAIIAEGRETSYGELYRLVNGYAEYLREQGIRKGDIIVSRAEQNLAYAVLYFAAHLSGGVIASMEKNMPTESLVKTADKLGARAVIADDVAFGANGQILLKKGCIIEIAEKYGQLGASRTLPRENDLADILFTTGTTGASKGVELSHKALTATAENLIHGSGYKKDTVIIVPGPLNHANAIRKLFTTIVNGSAIYILNGMMRLNKFFEALEYPNGSIACCLPPSAIRMIFQTAGDALAKYADRIDFIESATSPLPEPDKQRLCNLLPHTRLYNNYGSSESASVCMYDYNAHPGLEGCVGKPTINSEILIVDDDKRVISSSKDNMGLIACKGDINMSGYMNDEEATKSVLIDGIVYTNDVGYIDSDGFVYVSGRKGDVINVGGLKVAPTEVESAALAMGSVEDCICIGVDDAVSGKALKLLVVLHEGETFQQSEMRNFLRARLEAYKVPLHYEVVEKVERTFNGKLNRKFYSKER